MTLEEWAPYGIGEPDADGVYPDYRVPAELRPPAPSAVGTSGGRTVWWADIVPLWHLVARDLAERYHLDLHDPAVLARPWPGIRNLILGLLSEPSRLANALRG